MCPVVRDLEVVRFRVAGFWRRLAASVLDTLVLLPLFVLLGVLLAGVFGGRIPRLREIGVDWIVEMILETDPLVLGGFALCGLAAVLYCVLLHAVRGQTLGKQLCGLRVITSDGDHPTVLRALGRAGASLLSAILFSVGFIWIAFDREKRGLHDRLAGTYVVRSASERSERSHATAGSAEVASVRTT
jgi:uncharacterized RDD family membrane protein YckC